MRRRDTDEVAMARGEGGGIVSGWDGMGWGNCEEKLAELRGV